MQRLEKALRQGGWTHELVPTGNGNPTALADILDRSLHASVARFTGGLSPAALLEAYLDWATHLANAPGKRLQLSEKAMRKATRFARYAYQYAIEGKTSENCIAPLPQDHRFVSDAWQKWPYVLIYQAFLLQQQWWHNATTGDDGGIRRAPNP